MVKKAICLVVKLIVRILFRLDMSDCEKITDKQVLIIAPHSSFFDAAYVVLAAGGHDFVPVANYYQCRSKFFGWLLGLFDAIPKRLFTKDISTVMNIMKTAKAGKSVMMFPAGRVTTDGRDFEPVNGDSLVKLVKKLGLPVWEYHNTGGYFIRPKWRKRISCVPLKLSMHPLVSAREVEELSASELREVLLKGIAQDASMVPEQWVDKPADVRGLEGVLFMCPQCKEKHRMTAFGKSALRCTACGAEFPFSPRYTTVGDWTISDWNQFQIDELSDLRGYTFTAPVTPYGFADNKASSMVPVGRGELTITDFSVTFRGTYRGKETEFTHTIVDVPVLPFDTQQEVELYHDGELIYFYFDDGKLADEWTLLWEISATRYRREHGDF